MMLKKKSGLAFLLIIFISLVLAEEPPSLENQQFYGMVTWDLNAIAPLYINAKIGTMQFSAVIEDNVCLTLCSGNYGYFPSNILRVQGKSGDKIEFYVDTKLMQTVDYKAGEVSKSDFDLTTKPVECKPSVANCGGWSDCSNGQRTRVCEDSNKCTPANTTIIEVENCDLKKEEKPSDGSVKVQNQTGVLNVTQNASVTLKSCTYNWDCSGWSVCSDGKESRTCKEIHNCDTLFKEGKASSVVKLSKPAEVRLCEESKPSLPETVPSVVIPSVVSPLPKKQPSCSDGIQNQNEQAVDCGGSCDACPSVGLSIWLYIVGIVVLLGLIGILLYFYVRSRQSRDAVRVDEDLELRSAYDRGSARGLSEQEITEKLVQRGWDRRLLEQFLRRR